MRLFGVGGEGRKNKMKKWSQDWIVVVRKCADEKWRDIIKGIGIDYGDRNCKLCQKAQVCKYCPVFDNTGVEECRGTPYKDWKNHFINHAYYKGKPRVIDEEAKRLAKNMQRFLYALADEMEVKLKEEEVTYSQGDIFEMAGEQYILAQVDCSKMALITIQGRDLGNRWCKPVTVGKTYAVTLNEFDQICGREEVDEFKLIKKGGDQ